ncbi:hypothetical protein ABVT39_004920 [Epinephelus coioides]
MERDSKRPCLLDTGSQVTLFSESFFRKWLSGEQKRGPQDPHWQTLKAANGLHIPYTEYAILDFSVGGVTVPDPVYVSPNSEVVLWTQLNGAKNTSDFCALVEGPERDDEWQVARTVQAQVNPNQIQGEKDLVLTLDPGVTEVDVQASHITMEDPHPASLLKGLEVGAAAATATQAPSGQVKLARPSFTSTPTAPALPAVSSDEPKEDEIDELYKPFITEDSVSLTGEDIDQIPVTILRDSGVNQSLLLRSV